MINATLNDHAFQFKDGISILEACRSVGIDIPTLCNDERLKPIGSCRMCLVQVEGLPHPVTSCNVTLDDGMVVHTHTTALEHQRAMLLRMLAQDHPADSFTQFPEKTFYQLASHYGLNATDFDGRRHSKLVDDSHPYIHVDMSQCILCYRCVRICEELQGQFVWQIFDRGHKTRIVPDSGINLLGSSCVSCGACVDTCPSGALEDKSILERGVGTDWTRTTCSYCGTGCEIKVATKEDKIVSIRPVLDAAVSKGHLCVKGRYAFDFVRAADRITEPMIREDNEWRSVSWEDAIAFTATTLEQLAKQYGPDSIAILGSARGTNEENYLAQKFARVVIGTNNIDCCARVCHAPTSAAMKQMIGTGAATNSYDDIEKARTILIFGANPTENHPIIGARIKQAALSGAKLIVIDPRAIELSQYAEIHLRPLPGSNIPLLNAIAHTIVEEQLYDSTFLESRVSEFNEFREFIEDFSPESIAETCGVSAGLIRDAARLYAREKPAICFHGLGATEHTQGTEGVMCLVNLALLTGNIGKHGTGINPLRGQNNVQGSAHMGCDPELLTGSVSLNEARQTFETAWQTTLPKKHGLNMLQIMDAASAGTLKALWAIGYDIALTNPDTSATERALRGLELVIVQDIFLNETAQRFGSVFLPAASSFERDGTFMNAERRIQRIRKAVSPVGQSKPDWQIICSIADKLGRGKYFEYQSAEEIWNEVRSVWPAGRGITYARLDHGGLQWPCPSEDHPGTEVLHSGSFPTGKASLRRVDYVPTPERITEQFPFLLITGRTLYQFNAGTMTMRTPNAELRPTDVLDIAPEDASALNLQNGTRVRVRSRYGEAVLPVRITSTVRRGELFATFNTAAVFLNRVTSSYRDRRVNTPEYKVTAVRLERE